MNVVCIDFLPDTYLLANLFDKLLFLKNYRDFKY